jgi:hypothetical protein
LLGTNRISQQSNLSSHGPCVRRTRHPHREPNRQNGSITTVQWMVFRASPSCCVRNLGRGRLPMGHILLLKGLPSEYLVIRPPKCRRFSPPLRQK